MRALERRWLAEGTASAEADLLAARVRSGSLSAERLSLAAHAGHPAAVLLVRDATWNGLEDWAERFTVWPGAPGRVALACAMLVLPYWESRPAQEEHQHYNRVPPREQIDAAIEYVLCPCARHEEALRLTFSDFARPNMVGVHGDVEWAVAHDAIELACRVVLTSRGVAAVVTLTAAAVRSGNPGGGDGSEAVREAIRESLVPWSLGLSDPLQS